MIGFIKIPEIEFLTLNWIIHSIRINTVVCILPDHFKFSTYIASAEVGNLTKMKEITLCSFDGEH